MLIGTLLPMLVLHRACACACTHAPDKYKYKSQVNITLRAPHTERPRETDWTERETRAAETATRERDRRAPRARTRLISSRPTPYSYHIYAPQADEARDSLTAAGAPCVVCCGRGGDAAARGGAPARFAPPWRAHRSCDDTAWRVRVRVSDASWRDECVWTYASHFPSRRAQHLHTR